ncbi:MAG: nuclear transport factor 2 family protein [Planctomycetes bacterium]|nr:nuclear transport factor 2 family protein [Planctomycetota bacterium]
MPTRHRNLTCTLALWIAGAGTAQALPPSTGFVLSLRGATVECVLQPPAGWQATDWAPLLLLLPDQGSSLSAVQRLVAEVGADAARAGFVVVAPHREADGTESKGLADLCRALRRRFRIAGGGIHAAAEGSASVAAAGVLAEPHSFQSFTAMGPAPEADLAALRRLTARGVTVLPAGDPGARVQHFAALHARSMPPGVEGEVARRLDDLHDAAANADAERYFAILPDDAVFLGTDASERWTGAEFRAFAMPWFARGEAWTYVALQRHIDLGPGDRTAWFDEILDHEVYGICRGSGVFVRDDGRWLLRQYHLTIPVPNELARATAGRIRAHAAGTAVAPTSILLVRHAERADASRDTGLSAAGEVRAGRLAAALRDLPLAAVYVSEFRRTAATVAPLCAARGLSPTVVPADDVQGLVERLRRHPGQTVLVCGHSNTLPQVLDALGAPATAAIGDGEYDRLFVVLADAEGANVVPLRYGP